MNKVGNQQEENSIDSSACRLLLLDFYLAYSSTMKMEVIISSEMLIDFHRAEQRYIPQE
jgi:hypothetical protein